MPNHSPRDDWWVDTGRQTFWAALFQPRRFWLGDALNALEPKMREGLMAAQVEATRPAFSAVLGISGVFLVLVGLLEATGATQGIGYAPAWTLLAGGAVIAIAVGSWHLEKWPIRLALVLLATVITGVFLSLPMESERLDIHVRVGLFNLLPISLLALLVRPVSVWLLVLVVLLLAALRVVLHGAPPGGLWLYWMYNGAIVAFGLMLRGYRTGFAVDAFRTRHKLWQQANTDALTGVYNRAGWNRLVVSHYHQAVAAGDQVSLVFFDVDHFKRINDTWGHERGDAVLQTLGTVLRARADERVWVARMGGEEFVVMVVAMPIDAVERFCHRVRGDFAMSTSDTGATLSAGVAHRRFGESLVQQLRRADAALYRAKDLGRDQVVVDGSDGADVG